MVEQIRRRVVLSLRGRRVPAFLYGAAHALDVGGALARNRGRFGCGIEGDARALRGDWERALNTGLDTLSHPVHSTDGKV